MIVMREIHLRLAAKVWLEQASRRSAEESLFRTSDPRLDCCLQGESLIEPRAGRLGVLWVIGRQTGNYRRLAANTLASAW
jgi:hypothetical protein